MSILNILNKRNGMRDLIVVLFFGKNKKGVRMASAISVEDDYCKLAYSLVEVLCEKTKLKGFAVLKFITDTDCKIIEKRGIVDETTFKEMFPDIVVVE